MNSELQSRLKAVSLKVVESEGSYDAPFIMVGEALGKDEELEGRPFVGPAGQTLGYILGSAKLSRSDFFITNVVPIHPPGNDLGRLANFGLSVEDFLPSLFERLEKCKSKVIITLGGTALSALAGEKLEVSKWRGSILYSKRLDKYFIPSFHPSFIMRMGDKSAREEIAEKGSGGVKFDYGSSRISLILDLKRLKEVREGKRAEGEFELAYNLTDDRAKYHLAESARSDSLVFDIETRADNIVCIGFSSTPTSAFCIDTSGQNSSSEIQTLLRTLFQHHKGLIAQNGTFDCSHLFPIYQPNRLHFDTMLAHHTLYPELPHSLEFLTSIYTYIPYYKWMGGSSGEQLWKYNCLDCVATFQVAQRLKEELEEFKLTNFFYGFVMPLWHCVWRMGWRGIRVDKEGLSALDSELALQEEELVKKVETIVGRAININSPKQLKELLYEELALPSQHKRGSDKVTIDQDALDKLIAKTHHPAVAAIRDAREVSSIRSKFGKLRPDFDGRTRTTYSQSTTDTGRLSSRKTIFHSGLNLQNIPRGARYRNAFIARDGYSFIEGDLAQAEARLVAWFSNDLLLKRFLKGGGDIHKWNASVIFKKKIEEVTKDERYFAKRIVHAFNYGLGPQHLVDLIRIETGETKTRRDAEALRAAYFNGCPMVPTWHEEIRRVMQTHKTLITPYGRRRTFFGRKSEDLLRKMIAFLPQSTCVDHLNHGMIRIERRLPEGAELLLQIHDAFLIEFKDELQIEIVKICKEEFSLPIAINNDPLVIPLDLKVGKKWGDMIEIK